MLSETPSTTYAYYQSNIKPKPQQTKRPAGDAGSVDISMKERSFRLISCPICKHGAADFGENLADVICKWFTSYPNCTLDKRNKKGIIVH